MVRILEGGVRLDCSISVRVAVPEDAPAIAVVETAVYGPYPRPLAEVIGVIAGELDRIRTGDLARRTWVAAVGGEIVGFSKCSHRNLDGVHDSSEQQDWLLSGITVAPQWQRKGIGRRLVACRLSWLAGRAAKVYYHTGVDNRASIDLHTGFGFEPLGPPQWTTRPRTGEKMLQLWFCCSLNGPRP